MNENDTPAFYSDVEERILKAFAAFITLSTDASDGRLALVLHFHHPEHNVKVSLPLKYDGQINSVNLALEKLAVKHFEPSKPWTEETALPSGTLNCHL